MGVPYTFASATNSIPLSQLDANFNTPVTIGSTTVGLGNTTTTLAGLANVSTTALTVTNDASISGLTVGKGGGSSAATVVGSGAAAASNASGTPTAFGYKALAVDVSGGLNSAFGYQALTANTTGTDNTAIGSYNALRSNTSGTANIAIGREALQANTTASNNTAVGYQAGYSQSTNPYNTYIGRQAGYSSTGSDCTFVGNGSGYYTTGSFNTLIGDSAGFQITSGAKNTVLGCFPGNQGGLDIRTASNYIVLSDGDGNPRGVFDSSGNLIVGGTYYFGGKITSVTPASYTESNYRSDSATAAGTTWKHFYGTSGSNAVANINIFGNGNIQNANNSYGAISDISLKENIVDATPKLEDLCKVKIRQYNLKSDETKSKQIGVIAQELEEVFSGMIEKDNDGIKGVKYSVFVPMLIKAIQELNTLVTTQAAQIAALQAKVGA